MITYVKLLKKKLSLFWENPYVIIHTKKNMRQQHFPNMADITIQAGPKYSIFHKYKAKPVQQTMLLYIDIKSRTMCAVYLTYGGW